MESLVNHFIKTIEADGFANCDLPVKKGRNCLECFEQDIYEDSGWAEYMCHNKNMLHISKFFPARLEESMELLYQFDYLPLDCSKLRVMTIGQGPGAEVLALKRYIYQHRRLKEPHIALVTMDKTPGWLCEYDLIIEGINYDDPFYWQESDDFFDSDYIEWAHQDKFAVNPVTELGDEHLRKMFPILDYGFDLTFISHFFSNLSLSDAAKFSVNIREFVTQRYVLMRGRNTQQFYDNLDMFLKIVGGRILYQNDSKEPLEYQFTPEQEQQFRPDLFKSSVRILIVCDQKS